MAAQERTNQILDAAIAEFGRSGFDGARMEDVAQAAGLSKGSLYLHFRSKDDLIAGLLDRLFAESVGRLVAVGEAPLAPSEVILALFRGMAEEMAQLTPLLPIWFEFYALAGRVPAVRERLSGYFGQFRDALAAVIEKGISSGEFRPVSPDDVAIVTLAELEGIALLWGIDPAAVDPAKHMEAAGQLILAGLRAPGGKSGA